MKKGGSLLWRAAFFIVRAGGQRILDELAILGAFPDSIQAMKDYVQLHRLAPQRELYVFHTSREILDIKERQWLGIRGAQ